MVKASIKVITFDLDDTLWEGMSVIMRAEQVLHGWLEKNYPRITEQYSREDFIKLRQNIVQMSPDQSHDFTYLRKSSLAIAAENSGYPPDQVSEQGFEVFIEHRNQVKLYEDVLPTLARLKTIYRLGALTNGNVEFHRLGLDHLFDFNLNAIEAGTAKPEVAFFTQACHRAGAQPDEIVHVGDHPEHDIFGAQQAGLRTIWINRTQQQWPNLPAPNAIITQLDQLPEILADWNSSDIELGE